MKTVAVVGFLLLAAAAVSLSFGDVKDVRRFEMAGGTVGQIRTALAEAVAAFDDRSPAAAEREDPAPASNDGKNEETVRRRIERLKQSLDSAIAALEPHSVAREQLQRARELIEGTADDELAEDDLLEVLRSVRDVVDELSFAPLAEAELPEGFPAFTPVGVIEVKQYPAYRLATGAGFWPLFRHIQSNGIAMTAPVEMRYETDEDGRLRQQEMAFLFKNRDTGRLGRQGSVSVSDEQPLTVVSTGLRGRASRSAIAAASRRLESWLREHDEYQADGGVRVMAYNSPFVPRDQQFFEVQIPIAERSQLSATATELCPMPERALAVRGW